MDLRSYRKKDGNLDFERIARVTAGWTDMDVRVSAITDALKSVHRNGKQNPLRKPVRRN